MAIAPALKKFLEQKKISYQLLQHPIAYTASEIAGAQHISGKLMVKSVLIKADNQFLLCVLPATQWLDFDKVKKATKAKELQLATEEEIAKIFPEYDTGAEPPIGDLHGLKVFADNTIEENEEIAFNGGTHTDLVKIKIKDFLDNTKPTLASIGRHV